TVYPVHPRNHDRAARVCETNKLSNVLLTQPVGYLTSISLVNRAKKIVTDSGGLQREAFFAQKQCVTVFDYVVWPETMLDNRNQLSKPKYDEIREKLDSEQKIDSGYKPFGGGHSGEKIVDILLSMKG
ncbi:MAG: UDP-N-acetylglucosamine 2-epimerase, partial [Eubacteriales bacterium]|nr:UDP-N-acetylglucosamine 2-epimerase [Eubacteriales bacterium]